MISFTASASNMENDIEQARASDMEEDIREGDIEIESDSDFEMESDSDIEMAIEVDIEMATDSEIEMATEARASNMEEDKASSPNKEKYIEMATNIVEKLDNEMKFSSKKKSHLKRMAHSCIYKVPQPLRKVNCEVYAPQLISIGPLHRGNEKLKAMEKGKRKYFKRLTERHRMDKKKRCDIVISIKNQEKRLRRCYSLKFKSMESSDFVEMILLDAVFIIEFFLESNDEKGPKSFKPRMTFDIREDLMLLENQLPLFIIEEIYDQVTSHSSDNKHKSFLDLATCYLREYLHLQGVETSPGVEVETSPGVKRSGHITDLLRNLMLCKTSPDVEKQTSLGEKRSRHFTDLLRNLMLCKTSPDVEKETSSVVKKETSPDVKKEPRHLTDLLRKLMLSTAIQRTYSPDLVKLKYSAIMLRKAGVRFQVTRDECLVNIKFDKGVLKIPHLKVDHNFERLVRNVMAMEESLYEGEAYICSYIKFMDPLIDSAEDVGLLVENGIILHWLGDDAAVSTMINNFCKNIGDNDTCFGDISQELNAHYENRWNHVKYIYFRNMWRGTGTITGAILLILTFIQTISSVKSLL